MAVSAISAFPRPEVAHEVAPQWPLAPPPPAARDSAEKPRQRAWLRHATTGLHARRKSPFSQPNKNQSGSGYNDPNYSEDESDNTQSSAHLSSHWSSHRRTRSSCSSNSTEWPFSTQKSSGSYRSHACCDKDKAPPPPSRTVPTNRKTIAEKRAMGLTFPLTPPGSYENFDKIGAVSPRQATRARALTRERGKEHESIAAKAARREAETDRSLAEAEKRDLEGERSQLATTPSKARLKRLILDKLDFLIPASPGGSGSPITPKSASSPVVDGYSSEECVEVRCLSKKLSIPIKAYTTPAIIQFFAADAVPDKVDPATSVVVECLVALGLERRMRSYECVRDVMESWEPDQQNYFRIDASERIAACTPSLRIPSTGFSFLLYHSSRPREWTERWITLKPDGQILAIGRTNYNPKNSTVLGHLSGFDVYTPNGREMKRNLKPPGKFCYVLKSQQRANLSEDSGSLIHYFCANDKELATRFYELTYHWGSCYLIAEKLSSHSG